MVWKEIWLIGVYYLVINTSDAIHKTILYNQIIKYIIIIININSCIVWKSGVSWVLIFDV